MIADVLTVMWKEMREIIAFPRTGGTRGGWLNLLLIVGVFGVFLPLQIGRGWVESPVVLFYWAWVPLFLVTSVIADSFAGERERRTLETLLASRLSDQAILFGKIGAAVLYGWGLTVLSLLLGVFVVNLAFGQGELLFYPLVFALSGLVLGLLGALLAAGAGVLVSLRAASVRQAAQTMSIAILLLLFVPVFGVQALPAATRARMLAAVSGTNVATLVLVAIAILAVLDTLLIAAALARFRRAKLILD